MRDDERLSARLRALCPPAPAHERRRLAAVVAGREAIRLARHDRRTEMPSASAAPTGAVTDGAKPSRPAARCGGSTQPEDARLECAHLRDGLVAVEAVAQLGALPLRKQPGLGALRE